jgi:hypothetical protein
LINSFISINEETHKKVSNILEFSSLRSQLVGILECWNVGLGKLGYWGDGGMGHGCIVAWMHGGGLRINV